MQLPRCPDNADVIGEDSIWSLLPFRWLHLSDRNHVHAVHARDKRKKLERDRAGISEKSV
jgi:hypothetical protein